MTSKEDVRLLSDVLAGKRELREAVALCAKSSVLESYAKFNKLPNTTNAVESHNHCSKGSSPDILKVALMAINVRIRYVRCTGTSTHGHIAKRRGTTSYEDLSQASRVAHTKVANKTRSRKRTASDDAEGPPDKHQYFKKGYI